MMKKYRGYISVVLILVLFCSLVLFRDTLIRYASRNMTDRMEQSEKNVVEDSLSELYDYNTNKKSYEYTFLEFGSVGCHSCRQMEDVMETIKQEYGSRVNVVFINISLKKNRDFVDYFGIATIPTQVLLDKNGKEFFRHSGFLSAEDLSKHFVER
ncbi:MAG: thioredoxin family protein [Odoribacter sp.]|nr:thioredoxin family protein [Odoribacter sp.]